MYFLDEVEKKKNQDLDFKELLALSVCNNVVILELGKRLEYTDPSFIKLKNMVQYIFEKGTSIPLTFFPWIEKIPIVGKYFLFEETR